MNGKAKHSGTGWIIALGAALGAALGVAAGNIGVWLAIGVAIGVALAPLFRKQKPGCPECAALHGAHQERQR